MGQRKFIVLVTAIVFFCLELHAQDLTKYVNPFIGTGGHGHTYPGATLPFGMVQVSPDTRVGGWDASGGYYYDDKIILGFSHLHLSGTGCQDYGDILFSPTTGKINFNPGDENTSGYRSKFNHSTEVAEPGYYSVMLEDYSIKAELTATTRVAFHRYTFPSGSDGNIVMDLTHQLATGEIIKGLEFKVVDKNKVEGMIRTQGWAKDVLIFFTAEFSEPIFEYGILKNGKLISDSNDVKGTDLKAYLKFKLSKSNQLLVKVGVSAVDNEGSSLNLKTEIPTWDFDAIRLAAKEAWNKELSKVIIKDDSDYKKRIFYTALYHTAVVPNIYFDVDRRYRGNDRQVHSCKDFDNYTVFSLWDTFRSTNPLYVLLDPARAGNMVKSLLAKYDESGMLPKWELAGNETDCMIGYHAIPVIVDAYEKGINDFDTAKALKAMVNSAYHSHPEMEDYKKLGYIPADKSSGSVSKTLEYSYDDWAIYTMAKSLGDNKIAGEFFHRAYNYMNLFDGSTNFFRGRNSNGSWIGDFNPFEYSNNYVEGNAWQYSIFVPHDINGLVQMFGGKERFISHLDKLFSAELPENTITVLDATGLIGQYAHGNEPSHHIAYVYNFMGEPWKTQQMIHRILKEMYTDKPDGLSGNEDCGQMSSWFNFSSIGFYPFCPGTNEYQIGSPYFNEVTINLSNGKTFTVKAKNISDKNFYIQNATLNGKKFSVPFIKHSDITSGGVLILEMGPLPNKNGGVAENNKPYSLTKEKIISPPIAKGDICYFTDKATVNVACNTENAKIYYTMDGSTPTEKSLLYKKPFEINGDTRLALRGFKKGYIPSCITIYDAAKINLVKASDVMESSLVNGVNYSYFESNISSVNQMSSLTPKKKGTLTGFSTEAAEQKEYFAFSYEGYIYVPADGIYSFYLRSDDGSALFIDNEEAVNNDGLHSFNKRICGDYIGLAKGYHPFKLLYFNKTQDGALEVSWSKMSSAREIILPKTLFHTK
jgi:predicted alpha-1,2-mannosidase